MYLCTAYTRVHIYMHTYICVHRNTCTFAELKLCILVGLWDSSRKSNLVLDQCLFIYSVVVSMFNLE